MKLTPELQYTIKIHILTNAMNLDETIQYLWKLIPQEEPENNGLPFSKEDYQKILNEGNQH